jgi:CheY-like chemotaxis protein
MSGDREHCLSMKMDGYVTKPFRVQDLMSEITRLQAEGVLRSSKLQSLTPIVS